MATTWLITREVDDASEERANAIRVPCVETKLLPWPFSLSPSGEKVGEPERSRFSGTLDQTVRSEAENWPRRSDPAERAYQLSFFTSRRAVAAWCASSRPALGEVAALSPSTSEKLLSEGIEPAITSDGGVVALAQEVLAWWTSRGRPPVHLRYPTSDQGLRSPEQAEALRLLAQIGELDRRLAYEITAPAGLRESIERSARGDWSISFASRSAVQHFFAAGAVFSGAPTEVACLGFSTERSWNSARLVGWPPAVNTRTINPEVTT